MQTIDAAGVTLHIRDEGPKDGRVLMLANSLGTDLRVWDALLPLLPEGLRVVRFDKRGHGLSDAPDAPYAMETLVADAEAVCTALDLKDITFVGLSIGGLIGQGLAAKRPDLIRALALMDTAAKIGTPEMWQTRIDGIRANGVASLADAILERWFTPGFRESDPQFALWKNMLERTPLEGYVGCCAAIAGADLTESTRALSLPVLAMAGAEDGSTPPELVRGTAELCGAEFALIDGAGHIPCVEQPEETARLINDFLRRTA
ncbi:3-oxoadipate enol-lactonase [Salipiger sp. PrR002]|uniref:3-oxoadipate enol-lactonase n=1 Tax=Salipiger sp. PrR002 TaxID=2706489 RepID=UPI0013B892AF|nr:3-oxoadipate enol-lactonase [Salipiger sp. PrR002]NDW00418.1 3-oxoadipate enol-lactonase [Salipiger sp. PrR002]NDW56376.1 3-oxoadipate enol-lactonase [Salipiger sp. PrR004]